MRRRTSSRCMYVRSFLTKDDDVVGRSMCNLKSEMIINGRKLVRY